MLRPDSLPEPIATWFEANPKDVEAVARCFTNDAIVKDERHTHSGIEEIRRWKAATAAKYTYLCEPFAVAWQDGMTVGRCRHYRRCPHRFSHQLSISLGCACAASPPDFQ